MTGKWALHVGVDWSSQEHQVCVLDPPGEILGERSFENHGDGLQAMASWLLSMHPVASEIAIAIEVPHGPVVETLLEHGFAVFAINPKQLDRFRDRFSPAGAKDDRRDALVLASSLRTDEPRFRRLETPSDWTMQLREDSRIRDELMRERIRLAHQLRAQWARYYGALLELGDPSEAWILDLFLRAPTPRRARRLQRKTLSRLLNRHRIRRIDAASVLQTLRAEPLPVSDATIQAASKHASLLVRRLRLVSEQLREVSKSLKGQLNSEDEDEEEQDDEQRDAQILLSSPGVGILVAATLLGEAGALLRKRDYQALRAHCGSAPVTRSSGQSRVVLRRYACHPRLSDAIYHMARVAVQRDPRSRERYAALRARGKTHGQALRTVADRLLAMICAMLRDQTMYDPQRYAPRQRAA